LSNPNVSWVTGFPEFPNSYAFVMMIFIILNVRATPRASQKITT
jgi:hypothetical protein